MTEKLFEAWSLEREIVLVKVLKHPSDVPLSFSSTWS